MGKNKDLYSLCYSRNIGILTEKEQQRFSQATVAIAGMGGIGSNTAVLLARMGIGKFRLADFDTFEYANVNRQYGAFLDTVGQPKVAVMEKELRRINPKVEVTVETGGFTADNADRFLRGVDLVIDAIDFYSIEAHLELHREARKHGLYVFMGSPVGFSACLQIFDPVGMSLEEYCGIESGMMGLEKQLRYACGVVPNLAHIDYFDVSQGASNTNFLKKTGPSLACATTLAASLVASEVAIMLANRRKPKAIPYTFQFDPYTFRYEKVWLEKGMASFDVDRALSRLQDRSSLIPLVLKYLYKRRKTHRAKVNGAELYYEMEGEGDNLLLIGPLGADSSFWARQVQQLAKHFRVITFDSRGTGFSTACKQSHSTVEIAEDAIALLKKLGIRRTHVVGLALGGLVAQHIAVLQPSVVDQMVLVSAYAKADEAISATVSGWQQIASQQGMDELFDASVESLFSSEYVQSANGEIDKLRTFFHLNLQDPMNFIYQSTAGVLHDSRALLSKIACPTLVLHGAADRVVDVSHGRQLAAGIRSSRFAVVERGAHFMNWDRPESFNETVLQFLTASAELSRRSA